jgi:GTP-binding protein HflX
LIEINPNQQEKAILVGMVHAHQSQWQLEDYLDELELLAKTAGALTLGRLTQNKDRADSAFFIGRGKAQELSEMVKETQADLVIFDDDLTPIQVKNLGRLCETKIVDRSGLILDIFARRARSFEARTQVELAQLKYLLPRLTRQWTHLSRQVGGIGTKGPGETQLEVDRRQIRQRIRSLKQLLEKITRERDVRRKGREEVFKVALVGYTNAGKSTLLNTLTASEVFVEDQLFATLDPTVRSLKFENMRPIVLIDTVGFIRKLPHDLVASFQSTLAEAGDADLLLHLVDLSHPQFEDQMATVNEVLKELKLQDRPTVVVFNKVDRLTEPGIISQMKQQYPGAQFISAVTGLFTEKLKAELTQRAESDMVETELIFNHQQSDLIAKTYRVVHVLERNYLDGNVVLKVRGLDWKINQLKLLAENVA